MRNKLPFIFICVIVFILSISNYEPRTWLSGWDTLHPEFNMGNYVGRIFFGVWQEHQGLGAVAAQAHASELPRMLIYAPLSLILPDSLLRYSYFFLTMLLGPLGVYFFLKTIIFKKSPPVDTEIASLGAAIFYLLNLGTLQHYYVPLEMFATHFASLGWLFLFAYKFIKEGGGKSLFLLGVFSLLSSSIAHTATLWYSYFFSLVVFLSIYVLCNRDKLFFGKAIKIIIVTILVNAFWLLPNLYFIFTHGQIVGESQIHQLFTQEAFAQNVSFASLPDLALFKNFLFNWGEYAGQNKGFTLLLDEWIAHLKNPLVLQLGYGYFAIVIIGIFYSTFKNPKLSLPFLSIFILATFFWMNVYHPLGIFFQFLQDNMPLFREAMRFPFTKFSILLFFVCSLYFGWGLIFLLNISKKIKLGSFYPFFILFIIVSLFYYMLPAFKGNFISPSMKVKIPQEYFTLFDWFNKQPDGRVATLPINSLWGWTFYDWGFQGAGFLWFGIKQPLLDREFDRWSSYNEQYYREMSYAIYSQNPLLLASIIKKYEIAYVLLDTSVIAPESDPKVLFYAEIKELLQKLENESMIKKDAQFGNHLFVYKTISPDIQSNAYLLKNPALAHPATLAFYEDFNFQEYGPYIAELGKQRKSPLHTLSIPFLNNGNLNIDITGIPNSLNDCQKDPQGNPPNKTTKIIKNAFERFIEYSSEEGPFCDHFSYQDLNPDKAYLIAITSRNIKGLPLRVCIANHFSKRCDIYTQLSRSKDFIQEIFLLSPMKNGNGFDINTNNFGIKGTPSVNHLKSIQVTPFDYSLLAKAEDVQIKPKDSSEVIVLPQSYDNGWKAYQIVNSKLQIVNWVKTAFPFFFGKKLKEHVLVNNWANGWFIDSQAREQSNNETMIIVYLPQYLQYLGFFITLITLISLITPMVLPKFDKKVKPVIDFPLPLKTA